MIDFYLEREEGPATGGPRLILWLGNSDNEGYPVYPWLEDMTDSQALEFSIKKWEWIANWYNEVKLLWLAGETNSLIRDIPYNDIFIKNYDDTCALCWKYHHSHRASLICIGCPVLKSTGQQGCKGTPWDKHHNATTFDERLEGAQEEVEFLKSLREDGPNEN